ncbi:MAG TPA: hypothetical protein VH458_00905 [Vicinamibacterales bacterium]|jgi:hypothetical protein
MQTYAPPIASAELDRLQQRGLIVGLAGFAVGAIGVFLSPTQFLPSWLIGFAMCLGLTLGALAGLMLQHMTGGQWGLVSRRVFEAGSRLVPYCVLLFIPIAILLPKLYIWARPDAVAADEILRHKQIYLNVPFFLIRAAVYFLVWFGCAYYLSKWSAAQDRGEVAITEADTRRFRVISAPGLLIYVVLISLGAIDWLMSLDPHWYSTIFGFIIVAGQGMAGLSVAIIVLAMLREREPLASTLRPVHFHDLGNLTLAFVMLWAYFSFSQFLIIWAGNLPDEIPYFLERLGHGWQYVSLLLIVGQFAVPFCLLLSRDLKRTPQRLARVCWFILAMRLLDLIWIVAPNFNQGGFPISLANVGIPVGLAGIWFHLLARQLRRYPLLPANDPYFKEMLAHGQHAGH